MIPCALRTVAGKWYNLRMITLILGIAVAGGVFSATYFAADWGMGWSICSAVVGFGVFQAAVGVMLQKRVKREMAEARKKSVPVDPKAKLPNLEPIPAEEPPKKQKRSKKKKEEALSPDEIEFRLREKETPEETKARLRASLLDDLPDLPDLPDEPDPQEDARAQRRADLLSDLPDLPDPPKGENPTADTEGDSPADPNDPFADIHWNSDQTTFTIRL